MVSGDRKESERRMTQTFTDIAAQMEEPFPVAAIDLLPKGKTERDGKTLCMALPYADVRVYEDRLNKLAPGEWSTPPPLAIVVGQKLVVYVTVIVCGVVHTDVGEAPAAGENAATESWAQAFKRACSQFGLGRYLYDLDKAWVPYNVQRKIIDLKPAEIQNVVRKMYSDAHIGVSRPTPAQPRPTITPVQQAQETHAGPTTQQLSSIDKLCEHLEKPSPAQGTLTYESAKELIHKLTAEYRDVQDMKREQHKPLPAKTVQSEAIRKMIANAKAKCATVGVLWEDAKTDANLARVEDELLTVPQVAQINGVIAEYGKKIKVS